MGWGCLILFCFILFEQFCVFGYFQGKLLSLLMVTKHVVVVRLISKMPRIKVLCRNPDDYLRETKNDIHKGEKLRKTI